MGEDGGLAGTALLLGESDDVAHMLCLYCRWPHYIGSA
jgi:hypothetical protein